ncbi:hypothetical protein GJ496_008586 [Pomphorhynchus laevis]|nr:hypothetical protein GJ496_008586 [Pomphorhynchus laevis]
MADNEHISPQRHVSLVIPGSLSTSMNWLQLFRLSTNALQQPSIELCATDIKNNADNLNLISNRKRLSTTRTINHNSERSSNSPNDPLLNTSDAEDISDLATISKSSTRANEYHITSQQCNVKAGSVDPTVVNHSSDQSLSLHTRPSSALSLKYMMSEKGGWGYTHSTMNASLLSRDRYNQKAVQTDLSICQNAIVMVMIPPAEMNKLSALQLHSFDHCCKPTPLITTSTQTEPTSNNKSTTLLNNTKGNKIRSAKSRDKRSLKCMHKVQSQFKHNIDRDSVFGIFDWMLQDWLHHRFNMTTHPMILASRHIYSSISLLSSSRILGNGFNNPDQISVTSSKSIVNNIIPSSPLHKGAAKHLVRSRSIQCSIEPAHSSSLISSKVNSQIDNCKHEVNQFIDQTSTNLDRFLNKITVLKAYADSKAKCNQRQFKGYINQINAVYDNNLNGLSNDVNDKLDLLRVRIDRLQIKLGNIKANASNKSMLTFDMAITNTEPPSLLSKEVLEKEVESLRIALQFKFNELASLRTKHNDTINKLDELGELGDRFQSSQQRIEELQALLELRQQNEKVANKNLAQLRHSYDQKVHENNLLRSENDQLSFKLQQYLIRNSIELESST